METWFQFFLIRFIAAVCKRIQQAGLCNKGISQYLRWPSSYVFSWSELSMHVYLNTYIILTYYFWYWEIRVSLSNHHLRRNKKSKEHIFEFFYIWILAYYIKHQSSSTYIVIINSQNKCEIILGISWKEKFSDVLLIIFCSLVTICFGQNLKQKILYILTKLLKSSKKWKIYLLGIYLPVEMK